MYSIITDGAENSIDRATKLLAGIPGGADAAIINALKRATSHLRAQSASRVREEYAITTTNLRMKENVKYKYHYSPGSFISEIYYSDSKIPLYRYEGTNPILPTPDASKRLPALLNGWATVHPSVQVKARTMKGTAPSPSDYAFVAQMKSGHVGIFERTAEERDDGSGRMKLKERMGYSVAQMVGNKDVQDALANDAKMKFDERMEHEVTRILNGWRG